jgi:hypothetical protein
VNNKGRGKDEEERERQECKEIVIIMPLNIKNSVGKEWLGN